MKTPGSKMRLITKVELGAGLIALHANMRAHVGYLVANGQHFTAVRLEAYADDLLDLIEKGIGKRAERVVRKSHPKGLQPE